MNRRNSDKFKRHTAIKLHISQILSGTYQTEEGENYLLTQEGFHISRVRLLGTVIDKWIPPTEGAKGPPNSITLDDGTGTIRIKSWENDVEKFTEMRIGDLIDIIGRIREYEGEIYILPEIIRKIEDPNWELVRELEIIEFLLKRKSEINNNLQKLGKKLTEPVNLTEKKSDHEKKNLIKDRIVELIKQLDQQSGVSKNELMENLNVLDVDFQEALTDLINEGTLYQPNPGKYKLL
ncbi:MAG: OB-fold nucleic acid binding domain-containing protein [Candidatus Helarchaeota archaeon]